LEDGRAIGSGFVVDRQGAVVTNYHVIEGAKSAQVVFADKRTAPVMGYLAIEPDRDLALIRINVPAGGLTPLPIAADLPRKGEGVAAFGAPKGFSFTASEGIVSAVRTGEEIRETLASSAGFDLYARLGFGLDAVWIQTSAPISDGNSGGPLLNMRGQVIGVNTWGHSGGQNLNFAGAAPAVIEIITKSDAPLKPLAGLPASRSHDSLAGTPEPVPGPSEDTGGVELPDHVTTRGTPGEIHSFTLHSGAVTDLAVSPSGRYLATAGADKTVCIVDLPTLETIHRLKADVGQFTAVAFSHDGEYLATGSTSGALEKSNLRIWEVESGKQVVGFSDRGSATQSVRFSPGGRFLVSTHGGGVADLRVFPRIHGVNAIVGRDRNLPCFGADFSPDGQYMALAGGDGQMYVWSLVGSPRSAGDMLGHNGAVLGMAFSPNGKFIASCGEDGEARIWSDWVTSGNWKTVRELAGKAPVTDVAWSPDGTWLATACADNRVRVWDLAKGKTRNVFSGHRKTVTSVAFLNSGDYLVSSSEDGTARLWQLGTGDKRPAGTDVAATPTQRRNKPDKKANEAVPTGDELAAVTKTVQGIFQDELAKAKLPTQKRELAETILRHGQEEKNTAAERYALLSEARRLAIESGATSAALDATDELIAWFDVDAVELQVETVQKLGQTVRLNQDRIELAAVALQFAAESYSSDRYGEAASLAAVASVAANKARDAKLIQAARQWSQRTREAEAPWDEYQTALEQLKAKPTDSAAHLAVGTYLCFSRGDWQAGLKHLAQGSDAKLRAVAARDLAAPADAESRIAIGRSWRELAETAHQDHRQAYLAAAHYWYTKALPDQSGLGKLKIEDLLKDIGEIPAEMQRK
ncbi:MAG: trypsin-like peptidase domain-containing protein, partial [Planctomycetes bacterium]|nr:trypsin-like peptidase domain-containing protein [Planctomycetota bacterium]